MWEAAWHDAHDGYVPQALLDARRSDHFVSYVRDHLADTVVAVDAKLTPIGVVITDPATSEIVQLAVAAGERGTGVAGALLAAAEAGLETNGSGEAWLAVVPGNGRARAFYERRGWKDGGPMVHYAPTADGATVEVPVHRYTKRLAAAATAGAS